MKNICIVGAGSFGITIANILAEKQKIFVLDNDYKTITNLNKYNEQKKIYPGLKLSKKIIGINKFSYKLKPDIVFFAIPSQFIIDFILQNTKYFKDDVIIVNLSKGFGNDYKTIYENCIELKIENYAALKGPTFASDLIRQKNAGMSLATKSYNVKNIIKNLFNNTGIKLDFSDDVLGVELWSILKNVYSILFGIIDSTNNSINLRYKLLSDIIKEINYLIEQLGGNPKTVFNYCGIGDLALTSLNDLSRNRTLGLLIGKGFYVDEIKNSIVLEGRRSLEQIIKRLNKNKINYKNLMIKYLYDYFYKKDSLIKLKNKIIYH